MNQAEAFDLLVIGGGSGGIATARRAARHGARVALVEQGDLGGTCVNVGCVPKKVMWHAASLAEEFEQAADYGFEVSGLRHDWGKLVSRREAYIERLNGIYQNNLEKDGIQLIRGRASLRSATEVQVGEQLLQARHLLLATGGSPAWPDIPGAELGMDSDGFFALKARPESVAVVGSGYIAVELAGVLQALGAKVSLLLRKHSALREFDSMLGEHLLSCYEQAGMQVLRETQIESLQQTETGVRAALNTGTQQDYGAVIWAIGRKPNTQGLNLEAAGVATDKSGFVTTDEWQVSSKPNIFAVGDLTGRAQLTPVAIAAGRRLADRVWGGQADRKLDYNCIPTVLFSHPPVGTVGLTEAQAREQYGDEVEVFQSSFRALYYGVLDHKLESRIKLICVGAEQKIVGCHSIGPGSDEMLQGFAVAVRMGARKSDFDDTVAIHPTAAEEFVTLG